VPGVRRRRSVAFRRESRVWTRAHVRSRAVRARAHGSQRGTSAAADTNFLGDPDASTAPPYKFSSVEALGFGLHLVDCDLPMQELLETVQKQAAAAGL
jgi:hypothetical protein